MIGFCIGVVFKGLTYLAVALIIYMVYKVLYKPWRFRQRYKGYANVHVSPKFIPVLGDISFFIQDIKQNRVFYDHLKDLQVEMTKKNTDLKAETIGIDPVIGIVSHKALKEVLDQSPKKIDRADIDNTDFLRRARMKMAYGCYTNSPSTNRTLNRRKSTSKLFGMNKISKHVPMILQNSQRILKEMKHQGTVDIKGIMALCLNRILMSILLGNDFETKIDATHQYLCNDGTTKQLDICNFFAKFTMDMTSESGNLLTILFPILNVTNIVNPWKRNHKNAITLKNIMQQIIARSEDKDSFWSQISQLNEFTDEEILADLMIILTAGSETSSNCFVAILYYLKKFPEVKQKLIQELEKIGITSDCDVEKMITADNLQECDYLANVVREALRIDPPLAFTLWYQAYEDTQICGVPIDKGTILRQEVVGPNNDPNDWLDPHVFEPNRHNPDSEFYKKSQQAGKIANAYSKRTFGHGARACPGALLASLELKVFTAFFLTQMEYEVEKEDLENDHIGFGIGSLFSPKLTVS
ncbi:unnamed protein product [Moneuplotes crassus]|uniref:Cytochrome P450 n=1 Tax=Euplotes crassus TaxID=5936 RepID=A0AAD1XBC8_EUPCR|nr:unnamed protein product [Moneuplotes crassus]